MTAVTDKLATRRTGSLHAHPVRVLRGVPLALLLCLQTLGALAASLDDIKYSTLPGDRVQVELTLSAPPAGDPLSFTIDNPARVALDFLDTSLKTKSRSLAVGVGKVESVTAVEAEGRTRVVINLAQVVPYSIKTQGNVVKLILAGTTADISAPALGNRLSQVPAKAPTSVPTAAITMPGSATGARLKAVDFRRGEHGEAQIQVDLSDPKVGINIQEQGGKLVVDFIDTALPEALDRKLDVSDFATPAKQVDTFRHGNGTRMVVTPSGLFEHLAYQSDNLFTLELKALTKEQEDTAKKAKFGYTGERLSLNFQDIEVRAVLQLIADFTGFNLIASDTVSGNVTLRLKNTPWDQAMDLILKTKGLAKRQTGNVIMVAPQEEIAAREKLELESQKQLQELAPLHTEFVQVNYAKAADIAAMMKAKENNLLSERGNVTVDQRTNTLLVQDTTENLSELRKILTALDIPVRQVLIESRIVIATEDFSRSLGVRFGYSKKLNQDNVNDIGGGSAGDIKYPGGVTTFGTPAGAENYIVNLPVAGPAAAFRYSIGKVGSYLLQLELSALQTEGRGEVISSPQVITANQKEAIIESGTEIPYQEASSSGATTVSFKKAVLSLKVTPQITPDDRVILDLSVNDDSVGKVVANVPSIDTKQVQTQVLVENGETVVLGGIFVSDKQSGSTRVPFFGDIPYLGHLFRSSTKSDSKKELLIFVTPKILKDNVSVSQK